MPITGATQQFTKANVEAAPEKPGVYELIENGTTIYYGESNVSIRARLIRHQDGTEGACTRAATHFRYELTTASASVTRQNELLAEYRRLHDGKNPRCNEMGRG
jgi:excinuclease UvrABC nuclease subunit